MVGAGGVGRAVEECPAVTAAVRGSSQPFHVLNERQNGFLLVGLDRKALSVMRLGLVRISLGDQQVREAAMGLHELWRNLDRAPIAGDGGLHLPKFLQRHRVLVVQSGVAGCDRQGVRQIFPRSFPMALERLNSGGQLQCVGMVGFLRQKRVQDLPCRRQVFLLEMAFGNQVFVVVVACFHRVRGVFVNAFQRSWSPDLERLPTVGVVSKPAPVYRFQ